MHILVGLDYEFGGKDAVERIRAVLPDAKVTVTRERAEKEAALRDAEIALGYVPPDLLIAAPRLRWMQQWAAGANWLMRYPQAAERPFIITNTSGIHAIPISEHIVSLMLAFTRQLPMHVRNQRRACWPSLDRFMMQELAGRTVLVVGLGGIGGRTAQVASALGMRVLGVRRYPEPTAHVERVVGPEQMNDVLPEADFVALTVPLTNETRGMIGEPQLRLMKPTSRIINIGRGGTIHEEALVRALREGWIAGAALDVFVEEPLPPSSPFWTMEQVIITPHVAGMTVRYDERAWEIFMDNLGRFLRGEPMRNVVDKRAGY